MLQLIVVVSAAFLIGLAAVITFGGQAVSQGIGFFPNQSPWSIFLTDATVILFVAAIVWFVLHWIKPKAHLTA